MLHFSMLHFSNLLLTREITKDALFAGVGWRRLWGNLIADFKYLKKFHKKDRKTVFIRESRDRIKDNSFKL